MADRCPSSTPLVATPDMVQAALDLVWEDSESHDELVCNIWHAMATTYLSSRPYVDCACTKIQQDEDCLVGYPSLLCEICDGKGVVPYVKLDGPELWEIVFGIANEVAHEITDEQYTEIADAINSVFIEPVPSPRAQALEEALRNLLHAVCGETGFANAVRQVSRLPWPWPSLDIAEAAAIRALPSQPIADGGSRKFKLGERLTKNKGSSWTGRVVGFYSTELTPIGYAIESETEKGSVQIYPEAALRPLPASPGASE